MSISLKNSYNLLQNMVRNRILIFELAKKDFKAKYLGSYLGIIWAFIQPTIMILIYWFVFQKGFKSMPVDNFPFILWLVTGLVPWFFITDAVSSSTNSIVEYSYLVKKIKFRVGTLPLIKITAALFIHLFFLVVLFLLYLIYGYLPDLYSLQIFYYMIATVAFVLGVSWLSSSLYVFLRDTGQVIAMLIQFGFWLTPIFYSMKMIPEKYYFLMKLNPVYYLVEGYRETFIYHQWFWEHKYLTCYYWLFTGILLFIGISLFKRLRPHFSDVL